jgi:tetratricopeptide (TPR) repeat protein
MLQESMLKVEALFASNHYQMAPLCMGLALVHVEQGRAREAQTCAKRAALLAYEAFGAKSARSALVQSAMAQVLVLQGCYSQAVSKLRAILDLKTRAGWNACHWSMALDRYALSKACASLGRFPEALQLAELATDSVVQQAAGERERAAGTLVGMALRARFLVFQGLVDAAALLARSILSHPLCSGCGMASSSSPTSGSAAGREGGRTGVASSPVPGDPREVREEEHGGLEEGGMELEPVCIAAHLVLTEVCRIRGEQQQAVEHASTARELAQARYTSSHPTCLEAALEWACAYTVLGPTLSAHLEVEAVVAHAEEWLKKEYSSVPPMDAAPGTVSHASVSVSVSHPLQFRLLAVKALILSANNRHASAVEHASKASAGMQALLAADNTPHGAAGRRNGAGGAITWGTWGIVQSQLDLARCLMEAGMLVESLQLLCSFFKAVDELWEEHEDAGVAHCASHQEQEEPLIRSLDGVREPNGMGGGGLQTPSNDEQSACMPEEPLPIVLDQGQGNGMHQVQNKGLERQGGQKRDARLHKLGFVRNKAFVWYQDQEGSAAGADGDERAQGGGAQRGGGVDLLQERILQSPPLPDKFRFSTLAALVQRGVAPPLSSPLVSPLSSPLVSACLKCPRAQLSPVCCRTNHACCPITSCEIKYASAPSFIIIQ